MVARLLRVSNFLRVACYFVYCTLRESPMVEYAQDRFTTLCQNPSFAGAFHWARRALRIVPTKGLSSRYYISETGASTSFGTRDRGRSYWYDNAGLRQFLNGGLMKHLTR